MKNIFKNHKYQKVLLWAALAALTIILAMTVFAFTESFVYMKLRGEMRVSLRNQELRQHITTAQIRSWMTFRYLNLVFHLPTNYLQASLNITDRRYPNLSIATLAKAQTTSSQMLLAKIVELIKAYPSTVK